MKSNEINIKFKMYRVRVSKKKKFLYILQNYNRKMNFIFKF